MDFPFKLFHVIYYGHTRAVIGLAYNRTTVGHTHGPWTSNWVEHLVFYIGVGGGVADRITR